MRISLDVLLLVRVATFVRRVKGVYVSGMLSSWKEIAHFFGKGVRTVQRWEKTLDLPIHRPPGAPSNVVLARTSDLEEWMHRGSVVRAVAAEAAEPVSESAVFASIAKLEAELAVLAAKVGTRPEFVNGTSTAPERLMAITASVSRMASIVHSDRSSRAA